VADATRARADVGARVVVSARHTANSTTMPMTTISKKATMTAINVAPTRAVFRSALRMSPDTRSDAAGSPKFAAPRC
jgi:hypothetical protein